MDKDDPRATKVVTSGDQQQISDILDQMQATQDVNALFVLCKFLDCSNIKNEPQFCQILFQDHINTVVELFQWMLTPKIVAARKKITTKIDALPSLARDFMKDNCSFYEQVYIAARNKKICFSNIFNFLRKDFFDKQTIYTALGYFADVMIPFAKYQFSGSFNLSQSLDLTHSQAEQTLSIMKILPETLIQELIGYCHFDPIFQFLNTAILVSIEDPRDYDISNSASYKLLKGIDIGNIFTNFFSDGAKEKQELNREMEMLENIANSLKQITQNMETTGAQIQLRTFAIIQNVLSAELISNSVSELKKSKLCGQPVRRRLHSSLSISSNSNTCEQLLSSSTEILTSSLDISTKNNIPALPPIDEIEEEDIVEVLLKILSTCVEIYTKIPKAFQIHEQLSASSQNVETRSRSNTNKYKQKPRVITYDEYSEMLKHFQEELQILLTNMEQITKFVYNENEGSIYSKIIPFASGENVKAITFMKLQFFRLLHNCLQMLQNKEQPQRQSKVDSDGKSAKKMVPIVIGAFDFKIEKVFPLEIIKKYLNQNRWNNLAHHMLEKICHLLIIGNYEYIKKNIEKDKNNKFSDSFLAYLIENFTKRDFIFLNTVKFASQGNLQSLYIIAKDLAYTLNITNQLVIFINEFEPWKKFLMTDLKNYEEKAFPSSIKPESYQKNDGELLNNIKVDEADSIKKLIENISTTKMWPSKVKNKNQSKNSVFQSTDDDYLKSETRQHMQRSYVVSSTSKKDKSMTAFDSIEDESLKSGSLKKRSAIVQQFRIPEQHIVKKNSEEPIIGQSEAEEKKITSIKECPDVKIQNQKEECGQ